MNKFKLFSIICLMFIISNTLAVFADNKDNFIPKEYVLTVPQILQDEEVYEEKDLSLLWNKWHADVRNSTKAPITEYQPKNSFIDYIYYVDNNGNISDIFVLICEKPALDTLKRAIKKDAIIYGYHYNKQQFYKFKAYKEVLCNSIWNDIRDLAAEMTVTQVKEQYVPIKNELILSAKNIKNSEHSSFYRYPKDSKRTKMMVNGGWIYSSLWMGEFTEYSASDFDDVEKIKYQQKVK